jgi:hypothetical protein
VLGSNSLPYSYDAFRLARHVDTASSTSERVFERLPAVELQAAQGPTPLDVVDFPG